MIHISLVKYKLRLIDGIVLDKQISNFPMRIILKVNDNGACTRVNYDNLGSYIKTQKGNRLNII